MKAESVQFNTKSRLMRSIQSLSGIGDEALADRIFAEMAGIVESFLENHPDYSEKESLMMDCAGMYDLSGNSAKSSELAAKSGIRVDGAEILEKIIGTLPEILQYAENDSAAGNDRSALYTAAYYLSVYGKGGINMLFLLYNLLDGVVRLENSGADVSEDLKIWPLLAVNSGFRQWHASKYGDDGSAGKLDATDPAVIGAKGAAMTETAKTVKSEEHWKEIRKELDSNAKTVRDASDDRQVKPTVAKKRSSNRGKGANRLPFDKKYLILAAAFLAVIVLTAAIVTSINKSKYEKTTDNTATETAENSESAAASNIVYESGATVLSSDWDWDSYRNEDGNATVDAILLVRNDYDKAITSIDFTVKSKNGDQIDNALSPGAPMTVRGYVRSGEVGIMTGEICPDEVKVVPDDSTYEVTSMHTTGIDNYTVPTGFVSRHYGAGKNDYDVSIDNPNDFEVSSSSTVVMAKVSNNKVVDSDATGSLSSAIPADTTGFIQEKAFYDPHLYVKDNEVTVYVIDNDFCMRAD